MRRNLKLLMQLEVPKDKSTERGRGFAFVDLEDYDKVDKACIQRYHEICGRNCEVKKAETKEAIHMKESLAGCCSGGVTSWR